MNLRTLTVLTTLVISCCVNAAEINNQNKREYQLAIDTKADSALQQSLAEAFEARGGDYQPRTEHLNPDGSPIYINRLISEDSPYLLQHAHNPVNWYPWGQAAFDEAKRLDRPVFLSIGYATCHWCHVMERESFESEAIARIINRDYIAIKVDREQRPDVDATFMQAVILLNGSGGWPMSSFLTPDGKPFYGGTYFPPTRFTSLLNRIAELWQGNRTALLSQAEQLSEAVASSTQVQGQAQAIGEQEYQRAIDIALQRYDKALGGFGQAPKFPQESVLYLLLENARRTLHQPSLAAAHGSLQQMARGGIHDHIAGGFHRYSTDNQWLVPHFEKMLYNQAALARNYLSAFQLTSDPQHARTAQRILDYVLREMTSPAGAFYSATDADSEGKEGTFFVWTPDQLEQALGKADAALASAVWNVTEAGNFEGHNILHLPDSIEALAEKLSEQYGLSAQALQAKIDRFSDQLLILRNQREHPLLDDKILTEWNAMMITALTEASQVLDNPDYLVAASRAAQWIWKTNRRANGQFWRVHFEGHSSIEATQADLAYLAEAMLALYDTSGDNPGVNSQWLDYARALTNAMIEQFWDADQGGFFMGNASVAGALLPTRPKDLHDGATPSGNGVAMRVLARLWHRTGDDRYKQYANQLLAAFSGLITQHTDAYSYLLLGASELLWGESGALQYAARGRVRVHGAVNERGEIQISIDIAPGWHINANQPLQDYLIGTRLEAQAPNTLEAVNYPHPTSHVLGFQRETLSLYQDNVVIRAQWSGTKTGAVSLELMLQACDDNVCLAPETLVFNL